MEDYLQKLEHANTIKDTTEKINYLNTLRDNFNRIKVKEINLSKILYEDRTRNVSMKLSNFNTAYFDYVLKTKIFFTSLESKE